MCASLPPGTSRSPVSPTAPGGSLRTQQLTRPVAVGRVGTVTPPPATAKLQELAAATGYGRQLLADILRRHQVPFEALATGGGGGEGTRLFDAAAAWTALELAFTAVDAGGDGMDPLAYGPTAFRSGAAAARAGVTPAMLATASDVGVLPVHFVGNGARRYQSADIDTWVAGGRPLTPQCRPRPDRA